MNFKPHDYQSFALAWLIQKMVVRQKGGGALFLDPGLGKTSITLCLIKLMLALKMVRKVLVIAPLRVVHSTWPEECEKWDQFHGLRLSVVHGTPAQREEALAADADIYLINPEGVAWLQRQYGSYTVHPFELLVVDESSKFKNWSAKRTKALRKLLPFFLFRLILTGTPSPNSVVDLFSQVFIVDLGEALGDSITRFRNRYCYRGGYGGYKWIPFESAQALIESNIKHLCLRQDAADHLDLPALVVNNVRVTLPEPTRKLYKRWEQEMFIALGEDERMTASNAGAKYTTCRQIANGGFYRHDEEGTRTTTHIHSAKIDAVIDLIDELQGKPVLIAFPFQQDLVRLRKSLPDLPAICGGVSTKDVASLIRKWNRGLLPYLAVQPQAMSHGVNLQSGPGRDIIWLGLTDSLETYEQLNKRIYRQGVSGQVRIHRILAKGTIDSAIAARLNDKSHSQTALLNALKQYKDSQ